jgi:hypothetical protein
MLKPETCILDSSMILVAFLEPAWAMHIYVCIYIYFFFGAGDQTQGLVLARQALFHGAKSPTPVYVFFILID